MYFEIAKTNIRVLGSLHMLPADSQGLPIWVTKAYEWCDELIFESDPPAILSQVKATTSEPLETLLSPKTWAIMKGLWPPPSLFPSLESLQPWAALIFGSVLTCRVEDGVEPLFLRWSAQHSKKVKFLESAEELATTLGSAPIEEVIQSIDLLASDLSAPQRSLESMYQAWLKQDLPGLYEIAAQSPAFQFSGVRYSALQRRNQAWASILQSQMATPKRTLVAVGALHLYGPENLLTLLNREVKLVPQND